MNVFGSNTPPKGLSLRLFRVWNKTRNVTPPPPVIRPYNNQFISEFVRYAPYWLIQSPTVHEVVLGGITDIQQKSGTG